MSLSCPKCHVKMRPFSFDDVEVDRCSNCGGIWLDKDELEHVLHHEIATVADIATHRRTAAEVDNQPAYCHRCEHTMMAIDGAGDIRFDWCDRCESTFFDKGELSALHDYSGD